MQAIEVMKEEHRRIEHVLGALKASLVEFRATRDPNRVGRFLAFCEFFSSYADRFHHEKEEDTYLSELEGGGGTAPAGAFCALCREHEANRVWLRDLRMAAEDVQGGDASRIDVLVRSGVGYYFFLREQIRKEDEWVYDPIRTCLDQNQQAVLAQAIERARSAAEACGLLQECERLYRELTGSELAHAH
jgi:hemerythrin-like domain-containing protein